MAESPSTEERLSELESRVEGIERLLAQMLEGGTWPPVTAPEAARVVAEEQHGGGDRG